MPLHFAVELSGLYQRQSYNKKQIHLPHWGNCLSKCFVSKNLYLVSHHITFHWSLTWWVAQFNVLYSLPWSLLKSALISSSNLTLSLSLQGKPSFHASFNEYFLSKHYVQTLQDILLCMPFSICCLHKTLSGIVEALRNIFKRNISGSFMQISFPIWHMHIQNKQEFMHEIWRKMNPSKHIFKGYFKIYGMSPVSLTTTTQWISTKILCGISFLNWFQFKLGWFRIFCDSHYQQGIRRELTCTCWQSFKYDHIFSRKWLINLLCFSSCEADHYHHAQRTFIGLQSKFLNVMDSQPQD